MSAPALPTRRLGGRDGSAQGLGRLGFTEFYGPTDDTESVATVHRSAEPAQRVTA